MEFLFIILIAIQFLAIKWVFIIAGEELFFERINLSTGLFVILLTFYEIYLISKKLNLGYDFDEGEQPKDRSMKILKIGMVIMVIFAIVLVYLNEQNETEPENEANSETPFGRSEQLIQDVILKTMKIITLILTLVFIISCSKLSKEEAIFKRYFKTLPVNVEIVQASTKKVKFSELLIVEFKTEPHTILSLFSFYKKESVKFTDDSFYPYLGNDPNVPEWFRTKGKYKNRYLENNGMAVQDWGDGQQIWTYSDGSGVIYINTSKGLCKVMKFYFQK